LAVLSEEEKQEMKEMAASAAVRDEFRMLKRLSADRPVNIDRYIQFLTAMSCLRPELSTSRIFVEYRNVKL
jgi:hypothetical protein